MVEENLRKGCLFFEDTVTEMKTNDLLTPEGTRDYLFEECAMRRTTEHRILEVFRRMGYTELMTPGIEFYDVFNRNARYFPQESLYKLTDHQGRLLVLRPDSTMPIARVAATRLKDAPLPLRLCYNQKVYTCTPSLKGRSDECAQLGMELIGFSSRMADLEVISAAVDILSGCTQSGYSLELSDIGYFKALMRRLPADEETKEEIRQLIKAKNYPELSAVLKPLQDCPVTKVLRRLPRLFGGEEVLDLAASLYRDPETDAVLDRLRTLLRDASLLAKDGTVTVDLGLVNKTDYYTGTILKGYLAGCGEEVLSGGRYDCLISEFGYDVPAIGLAVDLDAVVKMTEHSEEKAARTASDILVCAAPSSELAAVQKAKELRRSGKVVELSLFESEEEARSYAKDRGIPKILSLISEADVPESV